MSDETRGVLVTAKSGFNQFRNSIYFLQRFFKQHNQPTAQIIERLLRMGRNIGKTIIRELTPSTGSISEKITTLYHFILHSKVNVTKSGSTIEVEDRDCPLCKYKYPDIETPGCYISVGMMEELFAHYGVKVKNGSVVKSRLWGDPSCIHTFELESDIAEGNH
jgi:predicted hydrocarbon binding protein